MPFFERAKNENWPPSETQRMKDKFMEWAAWYSGDPEQLSDVYSTLVSYRGYYSQNFWSKVITDSKRQMLHVPLAGDIASVSADQLFSEPPQVFIDEAVEKNAQGVARATQDRLEEIMQLCGANIVLSEAAETASALGGVYLKIDWNMERYPFPVLTAVQPDAAFPQFDFRRFLSSVTFMRVVRIDNGIVFRHQEQHGHGVIFNRLMAGTSGTIGKEVPLDQLPETADLLPIIETGIDDLLVRYIPNKLPNRLWRGSALGMSDYCGLEGLMGALDECYTSWIDDLRRARGRIIVPEDWLKRDSTDGQFYFDQDQTVFVRLPNMGPPGEEGGQGITLSQFEIRAEEHQKTALDLISRIVSSAGFSPQSFGLSISGEAESGTALRMRERRTFVTQKSKQAYFKKPLEDMFQLLLMVDRIYFNNTAIDPMLRPTIEFADSIQESLGEMADALAKIQQAQAMSTDTKVRLLHPDWKEEQIQEEVEAINDELGIGVEPPVTDPAGLAFSVSGASRQDNEQTPDDEDDR